MSRTLALKLGIRAGDRVLAFRAEGGYAEEVGGLPEGAVVEVARDESLFDVVHLFVQHRSELEENWPKARDALRPGGLMWISYPKKSAKMDTDISRDSGWDVVDSDGWRPVTQVAFDETWSALRFRPAGEVGKRK